MFEPSSIPAFEHSNKMMPGRKLAIAGAYFQLGPALGFIGTVIGMVNAFNNLGDRGIGDPAQLAGSISTVLNATALGLALGIMGLILVCIAAFGFGYRAPWVFTILVIYGVLFCLHFSIGIIIGAVLLFVCIKRRREFFPAKPAPPPPVPGSSNLI